MGTISEKLVYLNGTKQAIKQAINEDFEVIDNNTTFREYADEISSNNAKYKDLIPKETKNATNALDISNSAGLDKALVTQYGNTYQEGEPTPDYPQEIQVVTGDNTIKVEGKNIFDVATWVTKGNNGTYYSYSNGVLSINAKDGRSYNDFVESERIYLANGNYYLSNIGSATIRVYTDSSTIISTNQFEVTQGYVYIKLVSSSVMTCRPMIEKGTTATTYEPYQSQNYPISLGNIELCKIGDYKDRIYPLNGKWYLEKKIGKVVLNGSETGWFLKDTYNSINQFQVKREDALYINDDYSRVLSNYYKGTKYSMSWTIDNFITIASGSRNNQIRIMTSQIDSVENFKTWLSTHNTTVYYVLATPITTEITDSNYPTLYNQLNNIKLFEGVNHITMTNESGLDVEFGITYYKDWKLD